ncbi:hypothetical protein SRHO_G00104460 [Serrasalmus rhombeus]
MTRRSSSNTLLRRRTLMHRSRSRPGSALSLTEWRSEGGSTSPEDVRTSVAAPQQLYRVAVMSSMLWSPSSYCMIHTTGCCHTAGFTGACAALIRGDGDATVEALLNSSMIAVLGVFRETEMSCENSLQSVAGGSVSVDAVFMDSVNSSSC